MILSFIFLDKKFYISNLLLYTIAYFIFDVEHVPTIRIMHFINKKNILAKYITILQIRHYAIKPFTSCQSFKDVFITQMNII